MAETKKQPKQKRNAAISKAEILESARIEFSEKGYDGARVDAIAKSASVNINLVYHYFKNKENLFISVMEEAYRSIRAHHNEAMLQKGDPVTAMTELIRLTFELFGNQPHIIGLLNSENMHRASHIEKSENIKEMYDPLLDFIASALERGVAQGVFRSGVDPVELFISINAECYFYRSNMHTLGFILHRKLDEPEELKRREKHVIDLILCALRP